MSKLRRLLWLVIAVLTIMVVFALPAFAQDAETVAETPLFDLAWVGLVIGFFLPFLTSLLKRDQWSTQAKRILALVVAAVAGTVNVGVQAGWEFDNPGAFLQLTAFSVIEVYTAAAVVYRNLWEGTAPEEAATAVGSDPNVA